MNRKTVAIRALWIFLQISQEINGGLEFESHALHSNRECMVAAVLTEMAFVLFAGEIGPVYVMDVFLVLLYYIEEV